MSRRAATLAVTGQHRGESASTSVGRGIPDAPMAQFVRGRQGCRPLRCCWSMVHTSGGTHRSRPASIVGGAFVLMGWQMVPAVHPHRGRRWGPWPLAGDCDICGWRLGTLGGRPLRRAGVSRRARRGYFVRCGGRPKTLPLETAIWATRRRLARGVGEEFCVRARRSFAAILDVWQEAGPQLWRKSPGDTRKQTGGKLPHRKKSSKTFIFFPITAKLRNRAHCKPGCSAPAQ